jgi:hypothetical protein
MHYLSFLTAINPFVLAVLGVVVICGVYDYWIQNH